MTMKPIAAAVAGALISGVAMYTVGAKTATVDAFTQTPALVQTADGSYVPASQLVTVPASQVAGSQLVTVPAAQVARPQFVSPRPAVRTTAAPRRTVYQSAAPAQAERVVVREEAPQRTWQKTAMIIGGSAASGAGVGAIMGGKKGALIGAAIGGGAATIYESAKRK